MIFDHFQIQNFRGIADVSVNLSRGDLVLLLGLNEAGKTTILKAIEAFDYINDPSDKSAFYSSSRNKSDLTSNDPAIITAKINLDAKLEMSEFTSLFKGIPSKRDLFEAFLIDVNKEKTLTLSRVFPFKKGHPSAPFYKIVSSHPFAREEGLASKIGERILQLCPFIVYFEDFTDRIPEKIYINKNSELYNEDWYDIIDGLFYHTSDQLSIESFKSLFSKSKPRLDDAKTVMKRVNKKLDQVFTKKWAELSGVKDIEETELIDHFEGQKKYFEIKITDSDGTTFSVNERSKGALWYLSFLMKTEFRRNKMRRDSGKPVFLIDEPASNLHSTAQQNMIEDFKKLVENTSVIYTTHSQYLISIDNIKNMYVIRRDGGNVTADIWADYIKEDAPKISHYQPLANLLQLVPNNLNVPWKSAVITEGPSDAHAFELMYKILFSHPPEFVIYPGTSAYNLGTLISLNIGWQANFRVVLDSDPDGKKAQQKYISEFNLSDDRVIVLPEENSKLESYFTEDDKKLLYEKAFGKKALNKVSKNEFQKSISILNGKKYKAGSLDHLSNGVRKRFEQLFEKIDLNIRN